MISFLVKSLIKIVLFNFYAFWGFVVLLLLLISSFVPLWLEKITRMPSIFKNLLRIVLWPGIQDIWRMPYVNLRRVRVFPLLGTVFSYMLSLVHLWCFQIWCFFFFPTYFCMVDRSIIESGVLKILTVIVELSIFSFNYVNFCFKYFGGLSLGA